MHRLLQRQIKKHFGSLEKVPAELRSFLEVIADTYRQADLDRQLLERSLDLTSRELLEANRQLTRHAERLEERVKTRTEELLRTNASLEREVAERRAAEEALLESEHRYQTLAENSPTGIFHADTDGRTLYVNKQWCELTGISAEAALGDGWTEALHPHDREEKLREWREAVAAAAPVDAAEFRILRSDGAVVWVVGSAVPLSDGSGRSVGYVGTLTDITNRLLAEKAIRDSEEKYRTLFESSRDTIYITTPEGQFLDINPAGVELFGYASKEEMLALDIGRQIYEDPAEREELVREVSRCGFVKDRELKVKAKDGRRLTVLATTTAERDASGRIVAFRGVLRDVTEQRELKRKLWQAQKMEAIGRLAGGVAHDFNNILTAIIGYSDMVSLSVDGDHQAAAHAEEIKAAGRRGNDLTRQLLAFSRSQILSPKLLDLNEIVADMETLLRRVIGEDIELVVHLDRRLRAIRADPSQLEQVIMNLAVNARDAMPDGGTFLLETSRVAASDLERQVDEADISASYVRLVARDSGTGINEEIQDQIFEPFFTTKRRGHGSGLGLATVYGVVQQSGGFIEVSSQPGVGSTFEIYLPEADEDPEKARPQTYRMSLPTGDETILVVEDEPALRSLLASFLQRQGYRVLSAADGSQGLDRAEEFPSKIDLLLADVVMPGMNGVALARRLMSTRTNLKVLLMSGYTDGADLAEDLQIDLASGFLQKPFSTETLAQRLRQILDPPSIPTRAGS